MSTLKKSKIVLAVDLDGTLTPTDTLYESILLLIRKKPLWLFFLLNYLLKGKAAFKAMLSDKINLDVTSLIYNNQLIDWLKVQKNRGTKIILCTAANEKIANSVADHLQCFESVIASNNKINIKSTLKREVLEKKYGFKGFNYVGNSNDDLSVWAGASEAILVNTSNSTRRKAEKLANVTKIFPSKKPSLFDFFRVIRLHQWLKNLLLFVPIFAAHKINDVHDIILLFFAFCSFCACASSVYIINDLVDLENDRKHPTKFNRPFASGIMPIKIGILLAPLFVLISLLIAFRIGYDFAFVLIAYFTLTLLYSIWLKTIVLIDCLTLSILYSIRIIAGAIVVEVVLSFWLLAFSVFIFLSLAFVKRYVEITLHAPKGNKMIHGRGYFKKDAQLVQTIGVVAGYLSVLLMALYIHSENVAILYSFPELIWSAVFLILFWVSWLWFKAHRGEVPDDPLIFAVRDKTSLIVSFLIISSFFIAKNWT